MKKLNILYIENTKSQSYTYYHEIYNSLSHSANIYLFNNYNNKNNNLIDIDNILSNINIKIDFILFGFGWTNCGNNYPNNFLLKSDIKKGIILNKEYSSLEKKLDFIKKNNFDIAFTVHHDYLSYKKETNTKFYHLPFAANENIFKDYKIKHELDISFSGIIRPEQTNNWREKIYNDLKNDFWKKINHSFTDHKHDNIVDYAKRINKSKIWLSTTGPADLVGTRYYEVMLSGTTLLLCNSFNYLEIMKDSYNCVMFDSLKDLKEKVFYYLNNDDSRNTIIKNAKKDCLENHTWKNRSNFILKKITELLNG